MADGQYDSIRVRPGEDDNGDWQLKIGVCPNDTCEGGGTEIPVGSGQTFKCYTGNSSKDYWTFAFEHDNSSEMKATFWTGFDSGKCSGSKINGIYNKVYDDSRGPYSNFCVKLCPEGSENDCTYFDPTIKVVAKSCGDVED